MSELAKRAIACRHWRWMPGMLRIVPPEHDGATGYMIRVADSGWSGGERGFPDLTDPATLGCLLALVREAWGCHVHLRRWASPAPDMSGKDRATWEPVDGLGRRLIAGPRVLCATEAEALVTALEAAP